VLAAVVCAESTTPDVALGAWRVAMDGKTTEQPSMQALGVDASDSLEVKAASTADIHTMPQNPPTEAKAGRAAPNDPPAEPTVAVHVLGGLKNLFRRK